MMTILYALLALVCLGFYFTGKYTCFLLAYYTLLSHLMMLDISGAEVNTSDFCIFVNIIIVSFLLIKKKLMISGSFDKFVAAFILFYSLEYLFTVLLGVEGAIYGLKVIRIVLVMLVYFVFKSIPYTHLMSFLRISFFITLFQGFLYLLQYLGIHLLYGYNPEKSELFGYNLNIPVLTIPFIFLCVKWNYIRTIRFPVILFLSFLVLLTGSRAAIISVIAGLFFCLMLDRKKLGRKQLITLLLGAAILLPIAGFVVKDKTSKQGDASIVNELGSIISDTSSIVNFQRGSGTFSFRLAMLVERWAYLIEHPKYLPFGVGTIHEDSPASHSRFDFFLGTTNEGREFGVCQIESGDITWVPVSLRFGLIGVIIHLGLFMTVLYLTVRRNDCFKYVAPLYFCLFLLSFDGPFFEDSQKLYITCLLMGIIYTKDRNTKLSRYLPETVSFNENNTH